MLLNVVGRLLDSICWRSGVRCRGPGTYVGHFSRCGVRGTGEHACRNLSHHGDALTSILKVTARAGAFCATVARIQTRNGRTRVSHCGVYPYVPSKTPSDHIGQQVGAGPVGLLTALRLAKAGIRTTVLEALPEIENSPRAAVYHPVAVEELDRAGVLEDCRKIGTSSTKIAWRKLNGEVIVEMERRPTEQEPYENLILGQHELADVIFRHLDKCKNSEILFRHRVVGVEQDKKSVMVNVETPNGLKQLSTAYLVGADGGRSTVRQLAGVDFEGFTWPQQIVATNVVYPLSLIHI